MAAVVTMATGAASAAPPSADVEYERLQAFCRKGDVGQDKITTCMFDRADRLRKELAAAVRKKQFEISEVEKEEPGAGVLSGKEAADRWRNAFQAEQSAWASYESTRCKNILDFEHYGGSGAGQASAACSIKLILRRIHELRD